MFDPSRDEVRQFFCGAWQKHREARPVTPLEAIAVDWIQQHPEYHTDLSDEQRALTQNYAIDEGRTNPFLHLAMHLSIAEQISIDQPPGIRVAAKQLTARYDNEHDAAHEIMECLGETLWNAQRSGLAPDSEQYIECIKRRARG